jgi:hypothetical protein
MIAQFALRVTFQPHRRRDLSEGASLQLLTAAFDAVDGSSARHVSAMEVRATKAPMIRRATHANRYDDWSRHSKISISGARR